MSDRRHLQLDDDAAQLLDRAGGTDATVPDKGDGFTLPLKKRAVEGVLYDRCRTVIVLGDRSNEGIKLAYRLTPGLCFRLAVGAIRVDRRGGLVKERQPIIAQVEHL